MIEMTTVKTLTLSAPLHPRPLSRDADAGRRPAPDKKNHSRVHQEKNWKKRLKMEGGKKKIRHKKTGVQTARFTRESLRR